MEEVIWHLQPIFMLLKIVREMLNNPKHKGAKRTVEDMLAN